MRRSILALHVLALGCSIESTGLRGPRDAAATVPRDGTVRDGLAARSDAGARADAPPASIDAAEPVDDAGACRPDPMPPGSSGCPDVCTGGCAAGVCTVDCRGAEACDDPAIVCPPEYACVIQCEGNDACDDGSITCPPEYACRLECGSGADACGSLALYCGTASCTVDCSAGDCRTLTVHCPTGGSCASC